jgi:hypothetical protein
MPPRWVTVTVFVWLAVSAVLLVFMNLTLR